MLIPRRAGELFDFVSCVDPEHTVSFNIESKVNHTLVTGYNTKGVNAFVTAQYAEFEKSGYLDSITVSLSPGQKSRVG